MNEILDMETIYCQERWGWLKEETPRKFVRDVITDGVPCWIIIVVLVFF